MQKVSIYTCVANVCLKQVLYFLYRWIYLSSCKPLFIPLHLLWQPAMPLEHQTGEQVSATCFRRYIFRSASQSGISTCNYGSILRQSWRARLLFHSVNFIQRKAVSVKLGNCSYILASSSIYGFCHWNTWSICNIFAYKCLKPPFHATGYMLERGLSHS